MSNSYNNSEKNNTTNKKFLLYSSKEKELIYAFNKKHNAGLLRSDLDGTVLKTLSAVSPVNKTHIEPELLTLNMKISDIPANTVVYTTKDVALRKELPTYFSLDSDGDLQVYGSNGPVLANTMLVSFSQILDCDASFKQIENIQYGEVYIKVASNLTWERVK